MTSFTKLSVKSTPNACSDSFQAGEGKHRDQEQPHCGSINKTSSRVLAAAPIMSQWTVSVRTVTGLPSEATPSDELGA